MANIGTNVGGRPARARLGRSRTTGARLTLIAVASTALAFATLAAMTSNDTSAANASSSPVASAHDIAPKPAHVAAPNYVRPLVEIATTASTHDSKALFGRTSRDAGWVLLGLGLSVLISLNWLLVAHLDRAYARPARRTRRASAA
jgi:hypothetical protein